MAPFGSGQGGGRGKGGSGRGTGRGGNASPRGMGKQGGFAMGPGGMCVCPACGKEMPHQRGTPCSSINCPDCGSAMTRK